MISNRILSAIRRDLKAGHTIRAIAKAHQVTQHVVRVERIKLGDKAPHNRKSPVRSKVALLTARGWGAVRIAEKLGVSAAIVYRYRREIKKVNMCAIFC